MSVVAGAPAGQSVAVRLSVLACPGPLCPHLEFAVAGALDQPIALRWVPQPALGGTFTADAEMRGPAGLAGRLVASLRRLGPVRFEVVEQAGPLADAERYSFTPGLGVFRTDLAANGDVMVAEGRLRELLARSARAGEGPAGLAYGLEQLLGTAWDEELEPLRAGGDGAPVSWLRRTG